ncbi:MAG: hypothetical protein HYY63_00955, partial [Elusimicrobia bacterium]|nr:hypothetical protein [Elusimicrobiota bacterium]
LIHPERSFTIVETDSSHTFGLILRVESSRGPVTFHFVVSSVWNRWRNEEGRIKGLFIDSTMIQTGENRFQIVIPKDVLDESIPLGRRLLRLMEEVDEGVAKAEGKSPQKVDEFYRSLDKAEFTIFDDVPAAAEKIRQAQSDVSVQMESIDTPNPPTFVVGGSMVLTRRSGGAQSFSSHPNPWSETPSLTATVFQGKWAWLNLPIQAVFGLSLATPVQEIAHILAALGFKLPVDWNRSSLWSSVYIDYSRAPPLVNAFVRLIGPLANLFVGVLGLTFLNTLGVPFPDIASLHDISSLMVILSYIFSASNLALFVSDTVLSLSLRRGDARDALAELSLVTAGPKMESHSARISKELWRKLRWTLKSFKILSPSGPVLSVGERLYRGILKGSGVPFRKFTFRIFHHQKPLRTFVEAFANRVNSLRSHFLSTPIANLSLERMKVKSALTDGKQAQKMLYPSRAWTSDFSTGAENQIDINTASEDKLRALFGQVLHPKWEGKRLGSIVSRITERRPFSSFDQLSSVPGIGDGSTFRKINVPIPFASEEHLGRESALRPVMEFSVYRDYLLKNIEAVVPPHLESIRPDMKAVLEAWIENIRSASNASELANALEQMSLNTSEEEGMMIERVRSFFQVRYGIEDVSVIVSHPLFGDPRHAPELYHESEYQADVEYHKTIMGHILFFFWGSGIAGMTFRLQDQEGGKNIIVIKRDSSPGQFLYTLIHESHHLRQRMENPRIDSSALGMAVEIPGALPHFLRESYAEFSAQRDIPEVCATLPFGQDILEFLGPNFEVRSPYGAGLEFIRKILESKDLSAFFSAVEQAAIKDDYTSLWRLLGKSRLELFLRIARNLIVNPRSLLTKQYDVFVVTHLLVLLASGSNSNANFRNLYQAIPFVLEALAPNGDSVRVIRNSAARYGMNLSEEQIHAILVQAYQEINKENTDYALAGEVFRAGLKLSKAKEMVATWLSVFTMEFLRSGGAQSFSSPSNPGSETPSLTATVFQGKWAWLNLPVQVVFGLGLATPVQEMAHILAARGFRLPVDWNRGSLFSSSFPDITSVRDIPSGIVVLSYISASNLALFVLDTVLSLFLSRGDVWDALVLLFLPSTKPLVPTFAIAGAGDQSLEANLGDSARSGGMMDFPDAVSMSGDAQGFGSGGTVSENPHSLAGSLAEATFYENPDLVEEANELVAGLFRDYDRRVYFKSSFHGFKVVEIPEYGFPAGKKTIPFFSDGEGYVYLTRGFLERVHADPFRDQILFELAVHYSFRLNFSRFIREGGSGEMHIRKFLERLDLVHGTDIFIFNYLPAVTHGRVQGERKEGYGPFHLWGDENEAVYHLALFLERYAFLRKVGYRLSGSDKTIGGPEDPYQFGRDDWLDFRDSSQGKSFLTLPGKLAILLESLEEDREIKVGAATISKEEIDPEFRVNLPRENQLYIGSMVYDYSKGSRLDLPKIWNVLGRYTGDRYVTGLVATFVRRYGNDQRHFIRDLFETYQGEDLIQIILPLNRLSRKANLKDSERNYAANEANQLMNLLNRLVRVNSLESVLNSLEELNAIYDLLNQRFRPFGEIGPVMRMLSEFLRNSKTKEETCLIAFREILSSTDPKNLIPLLETISNDPGAITDLSRIKFLLKMIKEKNIDFSDLKHLHKIPLSLFETLLVYSSSPQKDLRILSGGAWARQSIEDGVRQNIEDLYRRGYHWIHAIFFKSIRGFLDRETEIEMQVSKDPHFVPTVQTKHPRRDYHRNELDMEWSEEEDDFQLLIFASKFLKTDSGKPVPFNRFSSLLANTAGVLYLLLPEDYAEREEALDSYCELKDRLFRFAVRLLKKDDDDLDPILFAKNLSVIVQRMTMDQVASLLDCLEAALDGSDRELINPFVESLTYLAENMSYEEGRDGIGSALEDLRQNGLARSLESTLQRRLAHETRKFPETPLMRMVAQIEGLGLSRKADLFRKLRVVSAYEPVLAKKTKRELQT